MKYFILFFLIIIVTPLTVNAQSDTEINWKSWSALEEALKQEPKPVFLFFHAEWCDYCKKIQRKVFTKPEVVAKINAEYYAVEMDVERQDTILFEGVSFTNKEALTKRNGVHELPLLLASREGRSFSLPATIILNRDFTLKKRLFEYYTSKQILSVL